jgi:hypothetical protein
MITLNNITVGNDWEWLFWALFPRQSTLSQVHTFQFTIYNLQFTIYNLQGHKVCQKHAYFND